jgi:hypothetical protein
VKSICDFSENCQRGFEITANITYFPTSYLMQFNAINFNELITHWIAKDCDLFFDKHEWEVHVHVASNCRDTDHITHPMVLTTKRPYKGPYIQKYHSKGLSYLIQ